VPLWAFFQEIDVGCRAGVDLVDFHAYLKSMVGRLTKHFPSLTTHHLASNPFLSIVLQRLAYLKNDSIVLEFS